MAVPIKDMYKKNPDCMWVYGLIDPETGLYRYVGITSQPIEYRYTGHFHDRQNSKKREWLRGLTERGLKPILRVLEECDSFGEGKCNPWVREDFWLYKMLEWKEPLLNMRYYPPPGI